MFVSGHGSNLKAILNYPDLKGKIVVKWVITDKPHCKALDIAKENNISSYCIDKEKIAEEYIYLTELFKKDNIELIVLAGFLKLLPTTFVNNFKKRIINIHPALLPSYGGKGMYGMNVHKAVFESGDRESGATIHFVDETYDTGFIIAQEKIDISQCSSPEEIAASVLNVEHQLLPEAIGKIADGKIKIGV
mgnify:CR=1 FL=1